MNQKFIYAMSFKVDLNEKFNQNLLCPYLNIHKDTTLRYAYFVSLSNVYFKKQHTERG
jgi:hypothetical protein